MDTLYHQENKKRVTVRFFQSDSGVSFHFRATRLMGNPNISKRWQNRTDVLLHSQRGNGTLTWLYQENSKDTASRVSLGRTTHERVAMTQKTEPGQAGQYFDEFLMEQGLYEEATASALTRVANFEKMQDAVSQRATKQINNMLAAQN